MKRFTHLHTTQAVRSPSTQWAESRYTVQTERMNKTVLADLSSADVCVEMSLCMLSISISLFVPSRLFFFLWIRLIFLQRFMEVWEKYVTSLVSEAGENVIRREKLTSRTGMNSIGVLSVGSSWIQRESELSRLVPDKLSFVCYCVKCVFNNWCITF